MMMRSKDTFPASCADPDEPVTTFERFSDDEHTTLHRSFLRGERLDCPVCGAELDRQPVRPRPDVSYVRDRLWVSCPSCRRSTILDRREPA
jgi:hypothetical protein